jgi:hypothetical protein
MPLVALRDVAQHTSRAQTLVEHRVGKPTAVIRVPPQASTHGLDAGTRHTRDRRCGFARPAVAEGAADRYPGQGGGL